MNEKNHRSIVHSISIFRENILLFCLDIISMNRLIILLKRKVLLNSWRDNFNRRFIRIKKCVKIMRCSCS